MADVLTRYEMARVLGARALQIALGAPILVKTKAREPIDIAKDELENGKIPFIVVRTFPDGSTERVEVVKWAK